MADDPTTTGQEQQHSVAGADQPLGLLLRTGLEFDVLLVPRELPGVLVIDLLIQDTQGHTAPVGSYGISVPMFDGDPAAANKWAELTRDKVDSGLLEAINNALGLLLAEAAALALIEVGHSLYDKRGVLQTHMNAQEKLLRARLKLDAGRPTKWTAQELSDAIRTAMEALKKPLRTYPRVAKKIQEMYPGRAPKSGESLRKTVETFGIDWMKIKNSIQKRS